MKITFLGTGTSQGVPIISCNCSTCKSDDPKDKRLRSSILIEYEDHTIIIDIGPDFRQQMLRINNTRLDTILITHEHNDHVIGLDDVRPYNYIQKKSIDVYALPRVAADIKNKFAYAFNNPYPGAPKINLFNIIDARPFDVNGVEVIPIPVIHGRLEILGYRLGDFAYITDASYIDSKSIKLLEGIDILIINALRLETHPSHFNLDQALDIIQKLNPRKAYLTHLSHYFKPQKEWEKTLPENVFVGYDGLVIND